MPQTAETAEGKRVEWMFFAISFVLGLIVGNVLHDTLGGVLVDFAVLSSVCLVFWVMTRSVRRSHSRDTSMRPIAVAGLWLLIFLFSYSAEQIGEAAANVLGPLGVLLLLLAVGVGSRLYQRRQRAFSEAPDGANPEAPRG